MTRPRYISRDDSGAVWLFEQTGDRRTRHDLKLCAQDETDVAVWAEVERTHGRVTA